MNLRETFYKNGYLVIPGYLKNKNFDNICKNLDNKISNTLEKTNLKKIGGYKIGNLGLHSGKYATAIWELMIQNGIGELIKNILNRQLSDFEIRVSGNISFPGKGEQDFHTDGKFEEKMYLISLATEEINENNGPTEIIENCHAKIPYWKFFFKKKNKKTLVLSKGDLVLRKHSSWHRGTLNKSKKPRFLLSFLLLDKDSSIKNNFNDKDEIIIFKNFFPSTKMGRLKESIYVNLKFIFLLYKFLRSFIRE